MINLIPASIVTRLALIGFIEQATWRATVTYLNGGYTL